jgi:hypothetical protein
MSKRTGDREFRQKRSWLPDLDFLTAFFSFWFGAGLDEGLVEPVPVRSHWRKL